MFVIVVEYAIAYAFCVVELLGVQIVSGYTRALQTVLDACDALAETIDVDNGPQLKKLVDAAVGTKFSSRSDDCRNNSGAFLARTVWHHSRFSVTVRMHRRANVREHLYDRSVH